MASEQKSGNISPSALLRQSIDRDIYGDRDNAAIAYCGLFMSDKVPLNKNKLLGPPPLHNNGDVTYGFTRLGVVAVSRVDFYQNKEALKKKFMKCTLRNVSFKATGKKSGLPHSNAITVRDAKSGEWWVRYGTGFLTKDHYDTKAYYPTKQWRPARVLIQEKKSKFGPVHNTLLYSSDNNRSRGFYSPLTDEELKLFTNRGSAIAVGITTGKVYECLSPMRVGNENTGIVRIQVGKKVVKLWKEHVPRKKVGRVMDRVKDEIDLEVSDLQFKLEMLSVPGDEL